jgi:hypothetical protein
MLPPPEPATAELAALGIASARSGPGRFTLLRRARNEGMDLGSHNATLSFLALRGRLRRYRLFFLINSSAMGPFVPGWVPPGWHWTHAFTARMGTADAERAAAAEQAMAAAVGAEQAAGAASDGGRRRALAPPEDDSAAATTATTAVALPLSTRADPPRTAAPGRPLRAVRAVAASLVCLPEEDAGGPGPRLESWAVALDELGLAAAVRAGALAVRPCKTCPDADTSIVVGGEYALTRALLEGGHNVATLLSRYARGLDWGDARARHGRCNDNAHPSRVGTYGPGASAHPYETVFVKSSWHVAEGYTSRYAKWALNHLLGRAGTEGARDGALYRWGVSAEGTTGAAGAAALVERAYAGAARGEAVDAVVARDAARARRAEVAREARRAIGIPEGEGM